MLWEAVAVRKWSENVLVGGGFCPLLFAACLFGNGILQSVRDAFVRPWDFTCITGSRDYPESRTKPREKSRGMLRFFFLFFFPFMTFDLFSPSLLPEGMCVFFTLLFFRSFYSSSILERCKLCCCCVHIKSSFLPSFISTHSVRPDSLS